jgi:hypothetical protein
LSYNDTQINSKCIKELNLTAKTIQLVDEDMVINLHELGLGKAFLVKIPKAHVTKCKVHIWTLSKF